MTTRTINNGDDAARFFAWLGDMPFPYTITALKGAEARSKAQNRTIHKWFSEIARDSDQESDAEVKAHCNLVYGVPIKRRDDPEWESVFGYLFDSLSYKAKIKALRVLDIPITRDMKVGQLREYMDQMQRDYLERGVRLTIPKEAE